MENAPFSHLYRKLFFNKNRKNKINKNCFDDYNTPKPSSTTQPARIKKKKSISKLKKHRHFC